MGLAYMRKFQFRSVQLTSKLRTERTKVTLLSLWTADPASQGKVSTAQYIWQNLSDIETGKATARVTVIISLLYLPVTKVELEEHKRTEQLHICFTDLAFKQ